MAGQIVLKHSYSDHLSSCLIYFVHHQTLGMHGQDCMEKVVIFLNDFRWSSELIHWETLVHFPLPKNHFSKGLIISSNVPIFATSKSKIKQLYDPINSFMTEAVNQIETSPLICWANRWTGFYMITASVVKELNARWWILDRMYLSFAVSTAISTKGFDTMFQKLFWLAFAGRNVSL